MFGVCNSGCGSTEPVRKKPKALHVKRRWGAQLWTRTTHTSTMWKHIPTAIYTRTNGEGEVQKEISTHGHWILQQRYARMGYLLYLITDTPVFFVFFFFYFKTPATRSGQGKRQNGGQKRAGTPLTMGLIVLHSSIWARACILVGGNYNQKEDAHHS